MLCVCEKESGALVFRFGIFLIIFFLILRQTFYNSRYFINAIYAHTQEKCMLSFSVRNF